MIQKIKHLFDTISPATLEICLLVIVFAVGAIIGEAFGSWYEIGFFAGIIIGVGLFAWRITQ